MDPKRHEIYLLIGESQPKKRARRMAVARTDLGGFSLVELAIVLFIIVVVLVPLGKFATDSTSAYSGLSTAINDTSRSLVVTDRIAGELVTGNFTSIVPAVPSNSESIEFQKIVGIQNGLPIFGNPIHIELISFEPDTANGVDDNGNGLIDEYGLRIWEDIPPASLSPDAEDVVTVICGNVAKNGLHFTRQGAILQIEVTFQQSRGHGEAPGTFTLRSGVKMRNNS
jgi:hypothetical protein